MDYETPDGSQFSLRPVFTEHEDGWSFKYTSISAYVDGVAYTGKRPEPVDEIDEAGVLNTLTPVPPGCLHPKFPTGFTLAPEFDSKEHYLKAPSFWYDDCQPGKTFVAECVVNEVSVLEHVAKHPHPNLVKYLGCVVKDDCITHICLKKYPANLVDFARDGLSTPQIDKVMNGLTNAIDHVHSLDLAHNDVNVGNVCVDNDGEAILLDFDCCLPVGKEMTKGGTPDTIICSESKKLISSKVNDFHGLAYVREFLLLHSKGNVQDS